MEDDENGGLFNIEVSSSSEEDVKEKKVPRDFQSEADFQRVRAEYKPKIEVGELWKTLRLPIDNPSKPESQTLLHAIEELYFFKRYQEAMRITEDALKGELINEFRKTLEDYRSRCEAKIKQSSERIEGGS